MSSLYFIEIGGFQKSTSRHCELYPTTNAVDAESPVQGQGLFEEEKLME